MLTAQQSSRKLRSFKKICERSFSERDGEPISHGFSGGASFNSSPVCAWEGTGVSVHCRLDFLSPPLRQAAALVHLEAYMSLDYPFYEELCRRKHPARWWWRIGDCLYYLGFLPTVAAISAILMQFFFRLSDGRRPFSWFWIFTTIGIGIPLFLIGAAIKSQAYNLAECDGIAFPSCENSTGGAQCKETQTPDDHLER